MKLIPFYACAAILVFALIPGAPAAGQGASPTIDMLAADLASGDDGPRQVRARQLVPLCGGEVAWKMLPLLEDERTLVSFAALRVLEDVIHQAAASGNEADREQAAAAVLSMTAPKASDKLKLTGLRLLPYVLQEEHSLVHVAALLQREDFREPARAALEAAGTRTALAVLCDALPGADASFKVDLLRAIAAFEVGNQCSRVLPLLEDASPSVRAAALRALARTGDPALLPQARRICAAVEEEDAFDAWDGWLRLADALAERGGHWELAMAAYREILAATPHTLIACGALVGLGRYGDETVIPVIMAALTRENGAVLEAGALEAFRNLDGRAARLALVAAVPTCTADMQLRLAVLFGDIGAPEFTDTLTILANSEDSLMRETARNALLRSNPLAAAPILRESLEAAAGKAASWKEDRDKAAGQLLELAREMQAMGQDEEAGHAWLSLYRHAESEDVRAEALDGVRRFPVPEAYDVVLALLAAGDMDSFPIDAMVGVALKAAKAGLEVEGKKLMAEIMPRLTTSDAVRRAVHALRVQGPNPEFARAIGCVNRWRIVGPFPWNISDAFTKVYIGEPVVSTSDVYAVDGKELSWQVMESADPAAVFDLHSALGPIEGATAFALASIEVAEGGPAQIRFGSDDGVHIWVNGVVVYGFDLDRGHDIDQDVVEITLNAGKNDILVQILQRFGGWAFCLRLTHSDGRPLDFVIVE